MTTQTRSDLTLALDQLATALANTFAQFSVRDRIVLLDHIGDACAEIVDYHVFQAEQYTDGHHGLPAPTFDRAAFRARVKQRCGGHITSKPMKDPLVCADGAQVSIQASSGHYCTPRLDYGPYTTVEAGFPSVPPPASWLPYAEEPTEPYARNVFYNLPWACVDEFLAAHGGLVSGELPSRAIAE